jgi:hypothetical protein
VFGERRLKSRVDRFDRAASTRVQPANALPPAAGTTPLPSPSGRGVGGEGLVSAHALSPLEWNRTFLPGYFTDAPADFHLWLDRELRDLHRRRGSRLALIAPREAAKSTWITLAYVLRAVVERWESYVLILSDTADQANKLLWDLRASWRVPRSWPSRIPARPVHRE